jgi:hypothetical protein
VTIRFARAKDLKTLFDSVYVSPIGEALSANTCVLIKQIDFVTTEVSMVETGKAVFTKRHIHTEDGSGGTTDPNNPLMYLVGSVEFKKVLARVAESGVSSVTLKERRGLLTLLADHYVTDSGEVKERASLSIRQYPGAITDFGPIITPENLISTINQQNFDKFVSLLNEYGEFGTDKAFDGDATNRDALLHFKDGQLYGLTNYKGAYVALIHASTPANLLTTETLIGIEGRHLKKLIKLSSEQTSPEEPPKVINVYLDTLDNGTTWVTFQGDLGATSLITKEPSSLFKNEYLVFTETNVAGCQIQTKATRGVALNALTAGVVLQLPNEVTDSKKIVLLESTPNLILLPSSNIRGTDKSIVEIDPAYVAGNWETILVNSEALKQSLKLLKSYLNRTALGSTAIVLKQIAIIKRTGNISYRLLLAPGLLSTELTVTILLAADKATSVPDFLDSDE